MTEPTKVELNDYWKGFMAGREEALQQALKIAHQRWDSQIRALEKARRFRGARP